MEWISKVSLLMGLVADCVKGQLYAFLEGLYSSQRFFTLEVLVTCTTVLL